MRHTCTQLRENKRKIYMPMTRPTRGSSNYSFVQSSGVCVEQVQTCPQISHFYLNHNDSLYLHKLNIDYGHIVKPQYQNKEIIETVTDFEHNQTIRIKQINVDMSLDKKKQKLRNIFKFSESSLKSSNTIQANQKTQGLNERQNSPINKLIKEPISQFHAQNCNPEAIDNAQKPKNSSVRKLKQIVASKSNLSTSQPTTLRITEFQPNKTMTAQKNRGIQHCRIVRSYVGGSKMQIKIINYPNCSEYRNLCGQKWQ